MLKFFELLHIIPDGACIIDSSYHVLFWNKCLVQWSGLEESDVVGKNILDLFPELKRTKYRVRIDQVLDCGPPAIFSAQLHHHVLNFVQADGSSQPQQVTITPVKDDNEKVLALFTVQDMTHHVRQVSTYQKLVKNYEEELNRREILEMENEKLVAAIDQAAEAFIITQDTGEIEYINKAFTTQTGWLLEDVQNQVNYFSDQGLRRIITSKYVQKAIQGGEIWQDRQKVHTKDGSTFTASISIAPILSKLGQVTHAVIVQEDISKQLKLEEQYRETQKQEALATLIGGIAHDFNNLLSGMLGHLYLAGREVKELPKTLDRLKKIQTIANEAAEIVQQLMTFARKDEVDNRKFPLDSFLKEFMKLAEHVVPKSINLSIDFEHAHFPCQSDADRLQQSLLNIVQNAVDAAKQTEDSKIQLRLKVFNAEDEDDITLRHPTLKQGKYAQITVWDNGVGIQSADLDRVFDPFFTTKQMGSGLGLSVVAGNIIHNRGVVDVQSDESGTSFHLWLPLLVSEALPSKVVCQPVINKRILLVDDEALVRETCCEILETIGCTVFEAVDGKDALLLMEKHADDIDLVIMDLVMPRMGGLVAATHIREKRPDLAIVFMTAYDQSLSGTLDFENSSFMAKPFSPNALHASIESLTI